MKVLAVLSPSLNNQIGDDDKNYVNIDGNLIPLNLIHVADTEFDENNESNANMVLVKKEGFSLNYRDLGIIEGVWNKLKATDVDTFYPIGSDFCGRVVKKGKNVTGLNIGDKVIPECSYPKPRHQECLPGIPSNNASKELEIFHHAKLKKIPENISTEQASGMSIGTQTSISMIEKGDIKDNSNVLVTSISSNTSLFILNFLKDKNCNVYGLSYSGNKIEKIKKEFPFIKEVFSYKNDDIPRNLLFDTVFDPFSDTYSSKLVNHLNFDCKYVTCGVFNQSSAKFNSKASQANLTSLLSTLLAQNANIVGNCLGREEDLDKGIEILSKNEDSNIVLDKVFTESDDISEFIERSFGANEDRLGKVILKY
jgi:NADPH:quinone reductase-like Zn-dependent oxidoreductase